MGFLSFIGSAISSACSFIGSAISSIGSVVATYASSFIKVAMPALGTIMQVIEVIKFIANILGVTKEEDKIDELGAKALESDKKLENFDSTQEYIDHLRNNVKLDKEKFNNMDETQKLACNAVGASIVSKGISEKMELKEDIPVDFWVEAGLQKLSPVETKSFLDKFTSNDLDLKFGEYLKGNLSITENKQYSSTIAETLKGLNPEMSNDDIDDKVFEMKQISRGNNE